MRRIQPEDRELYIQMVREFYHTDAVDHEIPVKNIEDTFEELICRDTYAEAYILEYQGSAAGYMLLAKTFSQEAGGPVIWIEEIYIRPEYQGKGIGSEILKQLDTMFEKGVYRLRLEVEKTNVRAAELYQRQGYTRLAYEQLIKDLSLIHI